MSLLSRLRRPTYTLLLDERYMVDWVNFETTAPPVKLWGRLKPTLLRTVSRLAFIAFVAAIFYCLIIAATEGSNRKMCASIKQDLTYVSPNVSVTCSKRQ